MHDPNPHSCAIIVSHNPDVAVLLALTGQLAQNDCDFIVIDNDSDNCAQFAATLLNEKRCVDLVCLSENRGLASAINLGLRRLMDSGYRSAFLFDQDSRIEAGFCAAMHEAWREAVAASYLPVAALGPRLRDPASGRLTPFREFDRMLFRSDRRVDGTTSLYHTGFLISSGTLLCIEHLTRIGLMKDDYFIDNVDLEWCFRARSRGFALYGTDRAVLYHRIGQRSTAFLVRHGIMVRHSPLRCYYSTRNRLDLYRRHYAPLGWKLRDMFRFLLKSAWLLLFTRQRLEYWRSIRRGIADSRTLT